DHAADPAVEQCLGRELVTHAAARLDGDRDGGGDGGHDVPVAGLTGASGIEVDDVDPTGAVGLELTGLRNRVTPVHGDPFVVALLELDDMAVPQVDGREEVHQAAAPAPSTRSMKLRRMARPV